MKVFRNQKNAAKSILSSNSCSYCSRNFILNGACYKKHTEKCKSKFESLMNLTNYKNLYSSDSDDLSDSTKVIKEDSCSKNDELIFDFIFNKSRWT